MKNIKVIFFVLLIGSVQLFAQYDIYKAYGRYEAEASAEDLGRMWTFDNIPLDKFENEYGFRPTEEWLEDVRMSALQFGRGCSGAFVSADGL
ncbi:MAG: S46 family peptidase, partial [Melioribacteraceae bacterium]|nr:S46 family peptidase [Melioribacteraceae bacterium]